MNSIIQRITKLRKKNNILLPKIIEAPETINIHNLCGVCRAVDWIGLVGEKKPLQYGEVKIMRIKSSTEELRKSSCLMCQSIACTIPADQDTADCSLWAVLTGSTTLQFPGIEKFCVALYVGPDQFFAREWNGNPFPLDYCICLLGPKYHICPREISENSIDFSIFKDLIEHCHRKHKSTCGAPNNLIVPGLRVIDCRTRQIIDAPDDCQYLALSYVWGSSLSSSAPLNETTFPAVIEDSIGVTSQLGYDYLWVDRYCIPQQDQMKHTLIGLMGQIYSKASVTLVAAAGEDANYGLPGCGRVPRKPQYQAAMGRLSIIQSPLKASYALKTTKWATRGWTYQECYLSHRRLIFTDEQVIYLCNDAYALECLEQSASDLPRPPIELEYMIPQQPRKQRPSKELTHLNHLQQRISEFTRRQLSYEEDSLDAFLGILEHYKTRDVHHIWGLPIQKHSPGKYVFILPWVHTEASSTRRDAFPSWSWTGWAGGVDFCQPGYGWNDYDVFVNYPPGKIQSLSALTDFDELATATRLGQAKELDIDAFVIPLSFRHLEPCDYDYYVWWGHILVIEYNSQHNLRKQRPKTVALFKVNEERTVGVRPWFDQEMELEDGMLGLILGHRDVPDPYGGTYTAHDIMVVREVGDCFERVGMILLREVLEEQLLFFTESFLSQTAKRRRIRLR